MKPSDLPSALRALADRVESLNLSEFESTACVEVSVYDVTERHELSAWAKAMDEPKPRNGGGARSVSGKIGQDAWITAYHCAGLLTRKDVAGLVVE